MGPLVRIIMRYGVGALVMYGFMSQGLADQVTNDPDVSSVLEVSLGFIIGFLTEGMYIVAKRKGWNT